MPSFPPAVLDDQLTDGSPAIDDLPTPDPSHVSPHTRYHNEERTAINATAAEVVSQETARANAETAIRALITTEATSRTNADTALSVALGTEATTRANSDTALGNLLTTETGNRTAADSALTSSLAAEATARTNADSLLIPLTQKGANSGVVPLDSNGLIPQQFLPSIVLNDFLGVASSQAVMLAFTGHQGDWCIRTDTVVNSVVTSTTWIAIHGDLTQLSSWQELPASAGGGVSSVNGRTGAVTGLAEQSSLDSEIARATAAEAGLQPQASNLTALAGVATNGIYVRTGASSATVRALTQGTGITISNADGVAGNPTVTLADTAVAPAAYGDASHVASVTVDQQGRLTGASSVAINIAQSAVTGLGAALSAKAPIDAPVFTTSVTLPGDPVSALHAATKQYVDAIAQGLSTKASVAAATTANIALDNTTTTVDSVTITTGMRVLVKNQTAAAQNGIYIASTSGAWTRATDMDANGEVAGAFVFVEAPTSGSNTNGSTGWTVTGPGPYTLGSTAIAWTQFSGAGTYTSGAGLSLAGSQFSIATGGVTNAMLAGSIAASKISGTAITAADTGTVTSTMILDGTIGDGDIASNAGIALTKLAAISDQRLLGNVSGSTASASALTAAQIKTLLAYASTDLSDSGTLARHSENLSVFASTSSTQLRALLSDSTGTGSDVFATSPTLVTPNLGTPSALILTNATGLPVAGGGTGLAAITAHNLVFGNGTSALTLLAPGATGLPLLSQGAAADPAYGVLPIAGGGTGATDAVTAKTNLGLSSVFGNFGAFTSFGHSYTQRGGTPEPFSGVLLGNGETDQFTNFINRFTAALHILQVSAWGRSGAAIVSPSDASDGAPMGLGALFRYCYPSHWYTAAQKAYQSSRSRPGLNLLEFTFNDHYRDPTASIDGAQVAATFKQAMRVAIARMRLSWLVASDGTGQSGSVAFAGSGAWTQTPNGFLTKGTSQVNPTNGGTLTITLPSDMLGPVYVDVFLHANRNLYYRLPIAINSTQTRIPVAANYIGYPNGANSLLVNDEVAIGSEDMLVTALSETTDLTRSVTTSNSSVTVTCATAAANDVNKIITGGNIQAGTWISSVSVGVSYTLSQATSGSGASTFTATLTHSATVTRGHNGSSAASALINAGVGLSTRTGKITWSGTCTGTLAGTATTVNGGTGTTIIAGQGCANQRIQIVQRFLCSAADAGKTIIGTVSGLAANEDCTYDSWGIEDPILPPVLVLNQPEFHGGNIGTTHEGSYTTQYRTAIAALCGAGGEFDANVVLVDLWTTFRQQTKMTLSTAIAATGTTTVIVTPFDATNCVVQVGSRIRTWGTLSAAITYEDMYVTAVDKTNVGANDGKWKLTVTRGANGTSACDTISLNQTIYEGRYIRQDDYVHPTDAGHELIASLCFTAAATLTQSNLQIAAAGGLPSKVKPRIRDLGYATLIQTLDAARTAITSYASQNDVVHVPYEVTEECVLVSLGLEATVGGGAGATLRYTVYDDGAGRMGNLVYDSGGIAATGTGNITASPFVPLKPGIYWFGYSPQGNSTVPTVRGYGAANVLPPRGYSIPSSSAPTGSGTLSSTPWGIKITGQTGAAADPCPTTGEAFQTASAAPVFWAQFAVLEKD